MSKKLEALIGGITTAVAGAGIAIVTYIDPSYAPAISTSIGLVEGVIITILGLFTKKD